MILPLLLRTQLPFDKENSKQRMEAIRQNRTPISLLLDGLETPENLGLMLRLADAARLQTVYLTNCKIDHTTAAVKRLSRSVINFIDIQIITDTNQLSSLKNNAQLIALELTNDSIDYRTWRANKTDNIILVAGSEKNGISQSILQLCDKAVHLPMMGINTSMNVSCATSALIYWIIGNY